MTLCRRSVKTDGWTTCIILCLPLITSAYILSRAHTLPPDPLLAAIIMVPLFLAIRFLTPGQAALGGLIWGAVLCLGTVPVTSINGYSLAQACLLLAVPALYAYGGALYTRRYGFQPLALAVGWIAVELALHPAGCRQGLLPFCCGEGAVQRTIAGFLGYGFVAFAIALVNTVAILLTVRLIACRLRGCHSLGTSVHVCIHIREVVFPSNLFLTASHRPRAPPHHKRPYSAVAGISPPG